MDNIESDNSPHPTVGRPEPHHVLQSQTTIPFGADAVLPLNSEGVKMSNDNASNVDRAWELMKKIGFAMLVTRDGDKLRARPMSAHLQRNENAIYFLTDARRHKDDEIARKARSHFSDMRCDTKLPQPGVRLPTHQHEGIEGDQD